jgi:hypothetical protein
VVRTAPPPQARRPLRLPEAAGHLHVPDPVGWEASTQACAFPAIITLGVVTRSETKRGASEGCRAVGGTRAESPGKCGPAV